MKVVWLSNTPCSASEKLLPDYPSGGWLTTLEKSLSAIESIELHVLFYHNDKIDPFKINRTYFHPILRRKGRTKLQRLIKKYFNVINNEQQELKELRERINSLNPEIVHVHGTEDNFGLIVEKVEVPIVISIQGITNSIVEKFHSGISFEIAAKFESTKDVILKKSARDIYLMFEVMAKREQRILRNSKFVIGRTEFDRRISRLLSPESSYFVGQELIREVFHQNQWNKSSFGSKIKLVSISGDQVYKGFESIIRTAEILSKHSNLEFEWNVIGLKESDSIVRLCRRWLIKDFNNINLTLMGLKNENELVNIMIASDIYCQVSHIENSPNSLCEAMMLGLPCIANFAGGTSSILEDGKEGVLVQEGDPFSMAGAIVEMVSDFEKAKQLGSNARARALKRHNKEQVVNDLLETYRQVIASNFSE